jgi:hypothetical protein
VIGDLDERQVLRPVVAIVAVPVVGVLVGARESTEVLGDEEAGETLITASVRVGMLPRKRDVRATFRIPPHRQSLG